MRKALIAEVMRHLGSKTSEKKAAASRENGKRGGRPLGAKDSRKRKRRTS